MDTSHFMDTFATGGLIDAIRIKYPVPLTKGDRVRIKEGYDRAGDVGFYEAKTTYQVGKVIVMFGDTADFLIADAIEPYPYTREERIERAIEDYECSFDIDHNNTVEVAAALFAILDAGV